MGAAAEEEEEGAVNHSAPFKRGDGKPKRTLQEMAEEFGVTWQTLAAHLSNRRGPQASVRIDSLSGRRSYYEPAAMRAWWKKLKEEGPL